MSFHVLTSTPDLHEMVFNGNLYIVVNSVSDCYLHTVSMHANICICDPKNFPGITCYLHYYKLNQSWLDHFPCLTLLRAFNKITSVNSYMFGRSKNLLIGFVLESSWST